MSTGDKKLKKVIWIDVKRNRKPSLNVIEQAKDRYFYSKWNLHTFFDILNNNAFCFYCTVDQLNFFLLISQVLNLHILPAQFLSFLHVNFSASVSLSLLFIHHSSFYLCRKPFGILVVMTSIGLWGYQ